MTLEQIKEEIKKCLRWCVVGVILIIEMLAIVTAIDNVYSGRWGLALGFAILYVQIKVKEKKIENWAKGKNSKNDTSTN